MKYPAASSEVLKRHNQESILKIANKLTKDRPLDLQELYKTSINELKDSKNDISQAIYQLILRNYIIEGSKITKKMVLENNNRNIMFPTE